MYIMGQKSRLMNAEYWPFPFVDWAMFVKQSQIFMSKAAHKIKAWTKSGKQGPVVLPHIMDILLILYCLSSLF